MSQSTSETVQNHLSFISMQIGVLQARIQHAGWVSPQNKALMAKLEADRALYQQTVRSICQTVARCEGR